MKAGAWIVLALGFVAGLAGGTYYAWNINPVEYVDTAPASLRADFKAAYLTLIASAYASNRDLARAEARLALFPDPNPAETLAALAQQLLASGVPSDEARALALLASDLEASLETPAVATTESAASATSSLPTLTPTHTPTPPPTRTPTVTPGAPFELLSQEQVCDPLLAGPLLQVVVRDAAGQPVPGIEVIVVWDAGQDHFFTGLKPELGLGYGDFAMTEDVTYTLQLAHSDEPITGLTAEDCVGPDGELFLGSWRLTFVQP
jgi:hypothetical protein